MKKKINPDFSPKPPLGITPRYIYQELCERQRLVDLKQAIQRYIDADFQIPNDWINEYNMILKNFN